MILAFALALLIGGTIEGRVSAADTGGPLVRATVSLPALDRTARTDAYGRFRFADVEPGRWRLAVDASGYRARDVLVEVPATGRVRVDVALTPSVPVVTGTVTDASTGVAIAGASVETPDGDRSAETGPDGRFRLALPEGARRIHVWAYGYEPRLHAVPAGGPARWQLAIPLQPRPFGLRPLTVQALRLSGGASTERALFDREPTPGVVGVSSRQLREVPPALEPDVLRSLQAFPGVVQLNDLSARLHVRGGGPDQNLFLLDGVRIFAPYHVFGIFGAFNAAAVGRVELYRGALPARHGGALSSVVDIEQHDGSEGFRADVGGGALTGRFAARGRLPLAHGAWMVAGRRAVTRTLLAALGDDSFPVGFHDLQGTVSLAPSSRQQVRGTFFATRDRYRPFLEAAAEDQLRSRWANRAFTVRWAWTPGRWSTSAQAWHTGYRASLGTGSGAGPVTRNGLGIAGLRFETVRQGDRTGARVGLELERGRIRLDGAGEGGGYVTDSTRVEHRRVVLYAEVEHRLGPLRLAPGMRLARDTETGHLLPQPRVSMRWHFTEDMALTVGGGRSVQTLSTLIDDRYVLPGAPFWFAHEADQPVSRADGVSVALEGWVGELWSVFLGGYARRFTGIPVWRPVGSRTLDQVQWHDGGARGLELMARRHGARLSGWISYGLGSVTLHGDEGEFAPAWDRRHALDLAAFYRPWPSLSLAVRAAYGSGLPFWPQAGLEAAKWLSPNTGSITDRDDFPVWSGSQWRLPPYFRLDVGARAEFRVGPATIEPFASILNATGRSNVLFYEYVSTQSVPRGDTQDRLEPRGQLPLPILPTLGFDVRF